MAKFGLDESKYPYDSNCQGVVGSEKWNSDRGERDVLILWRKGGFKLGMEAGCGSVSVSVGIDSDGRIFLE